jgi:hypothetical protein
MPNYVTINGKRSTHFYNSTPGPMPVRKGNAGNSWKLFCGSCAAAPNGAYFRKTRGTGIRSTNALRVGASSRCGQFFINILPTIRIRSKFYSTARSCARILARRERQKKWWAGRPGARALPGRIQHQDPRQRRCFGQPAALSADRQAAP